MVIDDSCALQQQKAKKWKVYAITCSQEAEDNSVHVNFHKDVKW